MASISVLPTVSLFQQARNRIEQDIAGIINSLTGRKEELFEEINKLEKEFKDKQQQQQKELNKLYSIKARTEEELGENSLAEVQHTVIGNLQQGIAKLSLEIESCREPDYRIEVEWGMCLTTLHSNIADSQIHVVRLTAPTGPILLSHRESMGPIPVTISQSELSEYTREDDISDYHDNGSDGDDNPLVVDGSEQDDTPLVGTCNYDKNS